MNDIRPILWHKYVFLCHFPLLFFSRQLYAEGFKNVLYIYLKTPEKYEKIVLKLYLLHHILSYIIKRYFSGHRTGKMRPFRLNLTGCRASLTLTGFSNIYCAGRSCRPSRLDSLLRPNLGTN